MALLPAVLLPSMASLFWPLAESILTDVTVEVEVPELPPPEHNSEADLAHLAD